MHHKFIYVFDEDTKDILLSLNCKLLKSNKNNLVYVFENNGFVFDEANTADLQFALSDILTF